MCNLLSEEDLSFADNILFIIGNGFDISHDIESRYEDFYNYLVDNRKSDLLFFLEDFFNSETLWSDFENTLGEYDEESILDACRPDEPIDFDHYMRSTAAIEDSPSALFAPTLEELKREFTNWVNSISLDGIEMKFGNVSPSSQYLTFNYLETLETIYHVPSKRVFHIHGSRLDRNDYIFGHNNFRRNACEGEDIPHYEEEAFIDIINMMNEFVKDYKHNIRQCPLFHTPLQTIKKIVVVGHSLSEIDKPYFMKIQELINPQTPWFISCHSDNDFHSIEQKCRDLQINNYDLFKI